MSQYWFPRQAAWILLLIVIVTCGQAWGDENEDIRTLEMFTGEQYPVVSASRSPKPVSQIAENISVITSSEIEALDAHTLADVLATIPGVQVDLVGTPGSINNSTLVNGSLSHHVLFLLDGVQINNLSDNQADVGAYPVQNIDRIEIVKGPASSSWGPALGGVVNIITKTPPDDRTVSGTVSASIGDAMTGDYRGEMAGTSGGTGYYLFASHLHSDGLLPGNDINSSNYYVKLRRETPRQGNLVFTFGYNEGNRGDFSSTNLNVDASDTYKYLLSSLTLSQPLTEQLNLELAARGTWRDYHAYLNQLSSGRELQNVAGNENSVGGSAKISWRHGMHDLVIGIDYDHGGVHVDNGVSQAATSNRRIDKVGVYANDTMTVASFSVTPGIRYDQNNVNGDFVSPSLGVTWSLTDNTVLRGFAGRGFSLPALLFNLSTEKVWSFQAGLESSALKYLWVKGTYFWNNTWDIPSRNPATGAISLQRQLKQGFEIEAKTVPVLHTSLSAGYVFIDATSGGSGEQIFNIPRHSVNIALNYSIDQTFRASLVGRYIDWNASPADNGKYGSLVWDLHLNKRLCFGDYHGAEVFFSAHNLLNGNLYQADLFRNPTRWFDGGLRFSF